MKALGDREEERAASPSSEHIELAHDLGLMSDTVANDTCMLPLELTEK